jgi:hypothetical protein
MRRITNMLGDAYGAKEGGLVKRRHVLYVPGYDPRGAPEYYRMFRTQLRRFCDLYRVHATMTKIEALDNRRAVRWTIETTGANWKVATNYEFLRWEDIVRQDFARPVWWATIAALRAISVWLLDGWFFKIFRAHWRFGLFVAYPFVLLLCWTLISVLTGVTVATLANNLIPSYLLPKLLGILVAATVFAALLKRTESRTYMVYLFQDLASTYQYARRKRPDWEERLEVFAGYLVEAARAGMTDEIIIVGHSSGSFLAVDVVSRALARDPKLGRHGPRVVLLTVGANLPIVGFQSSAGWFRDLLAQLAVEDTIDWFDYQSRRDVMNFFAFDPIADHGIEIKNHRTNPKVLRVQFRDIVSAKRFAWLRWHFFSLHFQFVMANDRPAPYDYFMIVAGPFSLESRATLPVEVTQAVSQDEAAARRAWERIRAQEHDHRSNAPPSR